MPSGDRNGGDLGGGKSALGGLEVVKEANATMVVHASTIEVSARARECATGFEIV